MLLSSVAISANKFQTYLNVSGFVQSRLHDFEINCREAHAANVELINCAAVQLPAADDSL